MYRKMGSPTRPRVSPYRAANASPRNAGVIPGAESLGLFRWKGSGQDGSLAAAAPKTAGGRYPRR